MPAARDATPSRERPVAIVAKIHLDLYLTIDDTYPSDCVCSTRIAGITLHGGPCRLPQQGNDDFPAARHAQVASPAAHMVADAKAVAEALVLDLGAAIASVVGHIAAQLEARSREGFYEIFMSAVRESEMEFTWLRAGRRQRSLK